MTEKFPSPQPAPAGLNADDFLTLAEQVWPVSSDPVFKTRKPNPACPGVADLTHFGALVEREVLSRAAVADLLEIVRTTIGNVRSLGPAGALAPVYTPYRIWLAQLEAAYTKATGAQA